MSIIAVESQFSVLVLLCKHARTSTVVMRKRQHHQKAEVAASRPQYREARWERAVKVYTVNQESRYLIVLNVPAIGVDDELSELFSQFGSLCCKRLEDYACEEFTQAFLVVYQNIAVSRLAKRKLDNRSFFGSQLHVTYAPEQETVDDTRSKLQLRRQDVLKRIAALRRQQTGDSESTPSQQGSASQATTSGGSKRPKSPTAKCTHAEATAAMSTGAVTPSVPSAIPMPLPPPPPPPSMVYPPHPHQYPPTMPPRPPHMPHYSGQQRPSHQPMRPCLPHGVPPHRPGTPPVHGFLPFGPGIPAHAPRMPVYPSMDPSWSNPAPPPSSLPRPYSLAEASQHLGEVQGPKLPLVRYSDRLNRPPPASHVVEPTTEAQEDQSVNASVQAIRQKMSRASDTSSDDLAVQIGLKSRKRRRI